MCLAIIKKNIYDATKEEKQKELFVKYCRFIKKHFGSYMKKGLQMSPHFDKFTPKTIPCSYGLKPVNVTRTTIEIWGADFVSNFISDLNSYLIRAPDMRRELLKFL